jgi:hypothetical protein
MIKTGDLIVTDFPIWLYIKKDEDGPIHPEKIIPHKQVLLIIDKLTDRHFIQVMWNDEQGWVERERLPEKIFSSVEK